MAINFDKADVIPTGELGLACVKATVGLSQAGNFKMDLQLKVTASDEETFVGRMIFDTLTFTQEALFRVKAAFKAFGIAAPGGEVEVGKEWLETLVPQFVGKEVIANVVIEEGKGEYAGTQRSKIKKYLS